MVKSTKQEKKIVFFFFLAWGFTFFNRLSINFAMPVIQEDLTLSASDTGFVMFLSTVVMAISAIIVGHISDKQGKRKKFLVPSIMIVGIGSALSIFANSFGMFVFIRVIVGLGLGPILGMIFSITEAESSHNNFGTNTGIIMAGDALLSNILGPIVITQLIKYISWQLALTVTSMPTILIALIIAKKIPEISYKITSESGHEKVEKGRIIDVFKAPNIITCLFLSILTLGSYFSIVTYVPLFLTDVANYTVEQMGIITSFMGVIFIFYAILIPRYTDKVGRKPVMIASNLLCALAPLLLFLFPTSIIGTIGYILFGGVSGAIHVFFNTIIPLESLPENLKTTGSSILLAGGEILGSALIPLIMGMVADSLGYRAVLLISTLLFVLAFFVSFTLRETNDSIIN